MGAGEGSADRRRAEYDSWHAGQLSKLDGKPTASAYWHLMALDYLPDVRGLDVLEIGCGLGAFAEVLASRGAILRACDFSPEAVDAAARLLAPLGVMPAVADITQLPFDDESFDVVVSLETLEHVPDPARGLRELVRVTRAGGCLIVTTPNYLSLRGLMRLVYLASGKGWEESGQPFVKPVTTVGRVRQLRGLGCRVEHVDGRGQFVPIPFWKTVNLEWMQHPHAIMKWFATHGCTVAVKAP